ncbi:prolyl endopeptidase [Reticulomyxa filosa]|uniref:Prolyl endopeptidase n=1 Tax=Reticulomyxa filosa TaxID=46433 RepID=X6LVL5_RETFI|nr:prolyl endopeptidase [Reticulomyxa filosa]|eukprot:ETO05963.1 prolyl endopeptidase [Reticulomyxa filosa]
MFIFHPKKITLNGENPTILYGYGGFDIALLPDFSSSRLVWLQNFGGVYAIANLRGGGEYGVEWHKAGIKHKKQNVFDDFQCAAEYLIQQKYTCPRKLAIRGGSNGGLLVAACCNQRPDLFGCAIAMVGVLDMLKFHRFTIGYAWCSDYGCADVSSEFDALYAYSPLHNIPSSDACPNYPALFGTTADHDDRVVPLHSFKFIAELQHKLGNKDRKKTQTNPLLIRIELKAGHGGSSLTKAIELERDIYLFLQRELNVEYRP